MEKKFNARSGRTVTYDSYPYKRFVIGKINSDGTLNMAIGGRKASNVTVDKSLRISAVLNEPIDYDYENESTDSGRLDI